MKKLKMKMNRGMSYVELIVVLSIFSLLSGVAIYNYGDFQANVDIKNLASDIASQMVGAQRSSLNGVLPTNGYYSSWKPSYGVAFDTSSDANKKSFIYFIDIGSTENEQNGLFDGSFADCTGECLSKINITKNNSIDSIVECSAEPCGAGKTVTSLSVLFKRPDSSAIFYPGLDPVYNYFQINITSPKGNTSFIRVYPSGRVQVR